MPVGKTREEYNAYMRKYVLARYHKRRTEVIFRLGGKCNKCGAKDDLELDHIDSETKSFSIAKALSGFSKTRLESEIAKLQVLCHDCHLAKSKANYDFGGDKITHGMHHMYKKYGCRCSLCVLAYKSKCKEYVTKYREKQRKKGP